MVRKLERICSRGSVVEAVDCRAVKWYSKSRCHVHGSLAGASPGLKMSGWTTGRASKGVWGAELPAGSRGSGQGVKVRFCICRRSTIRQRRGGHVHPMARVPLFMESHGI